MRLGRKIVIEFKYLFFSGPLDIEPLGNYIYYLISDDKEPVILVEYLGESSTRSTIVIPLYQHLNQQLFVKM